MKKRYFISIVIASLFWLLTMDASPAGQKKYTARVSQLQANSGVKCNGANLNCYDGVEGGDVVEVPRNVRIKLLFYSDTHEETISGPCTVRVTKKGSVPEKGPKSCVKITRQTPRFAIPSNPSETGRSIAAGISGGGYAPLPERAIPIRAVANLAEGTLRPTFKWNAPNTPKAGYYRVILKEKGKSRSRELVDSVIRTNSYTIPGSLPSLVPGTKYSFVVYAYENNPEEAAYRNKKSNVIKSNKKEPYEFVMPSNEVLAFFQDEQRKLDALPKDSAEWTSSGLSLLSLYLDYGMYDKAYFLAGWLQKNTGNDFFIKIRGLYPMGI